MSARTEPAWTAVDRFVAWRKRVHERVCVAAGSCTCPTGERWRDIHAAHVTEARELAERVHAKFGHPGPVEHCESPHDVICKAVWP